MLIEEYCNRMLGGSSRQDLWLVWSDDPESYAGGSITIGWASHARQVKAMTQTKRDTLVLQVGGWA